jgi:transcriptional regulator with XRE-family HTH domain
MNQIEAAKAVQTHIAKSGITHEQAAMQAGVSKSSLQNWFYGMRDLSMPSLIRIAFSFKLKLENVGVRNVGVVDFEYSSDQSILLTIKSKV